MRRKNRARVALKICIPAISILLMGGLFLRVGRATGLETPPAASPTADTIALVIVTPTPEGQSNTSSPAQAPDAEPTASIALIEMAVVTPIPAATPAPMPTPSPSPTPTPMPIHTPDPALLQAAVDGLSAYRRPNRMKQERIDAVLESLPDDLDLPRVLIVLKAYSLLGKVDYQFGGKSSAIGWDIAWSARETTVTTASGTAVVSLKGGLDCSGFVRWCFINAAGTSRIAKDLGSGTYKQWLNSEAIPLNEAQPGDLMFTNEVGRTNHDAIIVSNDGNGTIMVIHCAVGKGIVLENAKDALLTIARRPDLLSAGNISSLEATMLRHKNEASMADLRYLLALNW